MKISLIAQILFMQKFYNKRAYILEYAKPQESNEFKENSGYIINKNIEEFTKDKEFAIKEGNIMIDKNGKIRHNIPTDLGSGGAPIISYNKFKVIGYHIGRVNSSNSKYSKIAGLLTFSIKDFIKKYYS